MNRHPGGMEHTKELLRRADLPPNARVFDLGAGDGAAVEYLKELGYDAEGMDLCSENPTIIRGDFLEAEIGENSYDGVLSQCAFLASGQIEAALKKSRGILRDGGKLIYSDVSFQCPEAFLEQLEKAGFTICWFEDFTHLWKAYYIESIWKGTDQLIPECYRNCKRKARYYAVIAERI